MAKHALTHQQIVDFELAQDLIGQLIAYHTHQIATQRQRDAPDTEYIDTCRRQQQQLNALRSILKPEDNAQIAKVIRECSHTLNTLRKKGRPQ